MKIHLQTNKTRYSFNETIRCTVIKTDSLHAEIIDSHCYCGFLINGKTVYYEESENRNFQQILWDYWDAIGTVCQIDFQVEVRLGHYPNKISAISPPLRLEIDLSDIEVLQTATGEQSCYVRYKGKIYFVWHGSRGHRKNHRSVSADPVSAIALSSKEDYCHYLVDSYYVFQNGILMKNVKADGFKIYNPVFAGDSHAVLTPYGNAKIAHPDQFEALDDGDQYPLKKSGVDSYKAGYGRDGQNVYWFDGSNSTTHAVMVRTCKQPQTFVSLGLGYAKDIDHVYLEGRRIKGADPTSWRMLNRLYSRDKKHIFYFTDKVIDADPETFEVILGPNEDDLFDSMWGRDRFNTFKRWEIWNGHSDSPHRLG
jgi:hypothetical protein